MDLMDIKIFEENGHYNANINNNDFIVDLK